MDPQTGYYSLIQFCPDRSRLEAVNVGVLLFCPDSRYLDCRLARGNERAKKLVNLSQAEGKNLTSAKLAMRNRVHSIADQVRTVEDLRKFIESRGNDLLLTAPRACRVEDPEAELDVLFEELVGGPMKRPRRPQPRVQFGEVDALFSRPELKDHVKRDQVVTVPILDRTVTFPYAYRNGHMNLVKPEPMPTEEKPARAKAIQLALEGDLIQRRVEELDGLATRIVYVLKQSHGVNPEVLRMISELFAEYGIKVVTPETFAGFEQEVLREAHS